MFCPICRSEYREGFLKCADCDVPLVDEPPGKPEHEFHDFVEIMIVFDEAHIPLIKSVFDDAALEYFFQGESSHLLVPLPLSTRLMVRKEQMEEGKRILHELGLT